MDCNGIDHRWAPSRTSPLDGGPKQSGQTSPSGGHDRHRDHPETKSTARLHSAHLAARHGGGGGEHSSGHGSPSRTGADPPDVRAYLHTLLARLRQSLKRTTAPVGITTRTLRMAFPASSTVMPLDATVPRKSTTTCCTTISSHSTTDRSPDSISTHKPLGNTCHHEVVQTVRIVVKSTVSPRIAYIVADVAFPYTASDPTVLSNLSNLLQYGINSPWVPLSALMTSF